jgi:hypothetical protein
MTRDNDARPDSDIARNQENVYAISTCNKNLIPSIYAKSRNNLETTPVNLLLAICNKSVFSLPGFRIRSKLIPY